MNIKNSIKYLFYLITIISLTNCNNTTTLTFSNDIAPIIHKNCTPCHSPNQSGPFSLITYNDIRKKAKTIAKVVKSKYMPPWPADKNYSSFVGEKGLTDNEIDMLLRWIENNCLPGDTSNIKYQYNIAGSLGKPNLVLSMQDSIKIPGDNKDRFIALKIPFQLDQDTFIRAIEFVPGNKRLVHHMNGHLINYKDTDKENIYEGKHFIVDVFGQNEHIIEELSLKNDDGTYPTLTPSIINYLPGMEPVVYPPEISAFKIATKGALLIKNIHYGPTSIDEYDQSHFNIYFSATPPKRVLKEFQMGTSGISTILPPLVIPPDTIMEFTTQYTLPEDMTILTIIPHMHLIGKRFLAYAINPSHGDTIPLIKIPEWDFHWQYFYTFKKPVILKKNTTIYVFGVYDNTIDNPYNPNIPPKIIREPEGYMQTTDEMFQLIVVYMYYQKGDENINLDHTYL